MAPQVSVSEYGSGFWRSVIWWQSTGFGELARPRWRVSWNRFATGPSPSNSLLGDDDMAKQRGKRKKDGAKADATEGLPPLNLHAAGIDVGSAEHYVAVPPDRDAEPVRKVGSFTADLHRMAH